MAEKLPQQSRYRDTELIGEGKDAYFDLWERPEELTKSDVEDGSQDHVVLTREVGRLDLIAYRYYRDQTLWWVIAAVNNLANPISDMYQGQVITIPSYDKIAKYVIRTGKEE